MQPQHLVGRDGQQTGRIGVQQVGFGGERQPSNVGQRSDIARLGAAVSEFLLISRYFASHAAHGRLETFQLKRLQGGAFDGFGFLIPEYHNVGVALEAEHQFRANEIHHVPADVVVARQEEFAPEVAAQVLGELVFEDSLDVMAAKVAVVGERRVCRREAEGLV